MEFGETWLMSREKIKEGFKGYFCRKHDESQKSGHSEWQTQDSLITKFKPSSSPCILFFINDPRISNPQQWHALLRHENLQKQVQKPR